MVDFETYFKKLRNSGLIPAVCVLQLACLPVAQAELYKWLDKDGNVNYTQSPPPAGTQVTTIKPPPAVTTEVANERLRQRLQTVKTMTEQRQKQTVEKQKSVQDQAGQKRLCDQARSRLASYERPRVSISGADGNPRVLGEEERLRELEKSRGQVKELCK
jgi:hypothetical protein